MLYSAAVLIAALAGLFIMSVGIALAGIYAVETIIEIIRAGRGE